MIGESTAHMQERAQELEARLTAILLELVPHDRRQRGLTADTLLSDLGIGSMAKMSIGLRVEETLGVDLSAHSERVAEVQTVGDMFALIRSTMAA